MTDAVASSFGGQAAAQTETMQGKIDQMNNALGDLGEQMGQEILPLITSFGTIVEQAAYWLGEWNEVPIERKLRKENNQLNSLVIQLGDYNEGTERRSRLITEIVNNHPDFAKGLDLEKASYEDIQEALEDYNEEFENSLGLQIQKHKLDKGQNEMLELEEKQMMLNTKLYDAMSIQLEHLGITGSDAAKIITDSFVSLEDAEGSVEKQTEMTMLNMRDAIMNNIDAWDVTEAAVNNAFDQMTNMYLGLLGVAGLYWNSNIQSSMDMINMNENTKMGLVGILGEYKLLGEEIEALRLKNEFLEKQIEKNTKLEEGSLAQKREMNLLDGAFDPIEPLEKEYDARNRINEVINKKITLQQMLMEITAEQHAAGIEASHETAIANIHMALSEAKAGLIAKIMSGVPFPLNLVAAAGADKLINKAFSKAGIRMAATGADYIAEQPELLMVGESNRERVQVTPLEDVNLEGGTSGITLNISGNVLHDSFVEEQIIPSIKEGLRRGGSIA